MSDNFVLHELNFAPAEPLQSNETSIHVLDNDGDKQQERFQDANGESAEHLMALQQLNEEIRKDPAYKFLLQVSAFAHRRINKLTDSSRVLHPKSTPQCDLSANVCFNPTDVKNSDWMQIPEISGVIQLSADAYGHIKESEMIVNNFIPKQPLKVLIEHPQFQTLFARLVAIRMGLSSTLANSDVQKDRAFTRLHQEQTMLLRALQKIKHNNRRKWTEPGYY